jgi:hypothetical protein
MNNIPIPERMRHLGVDERGYPQFYIALRDRDGVCHFIFNDHRRSFRCVTENLCSLCGTKLESDRWFVGGPLSAFCEQGTYFDPPMHFECMRYAVQVCPWMAARSYFRKRSLEDITGELDIDVRVLVDDTMLPGRPAVFVAVRCKNYNWHFSAKDGGDLELRFFPKRPYVEIEYWQSGNQLGEEEGGQIAAGAVAAYVNSRD